MKENMLERIKGCLIGCAYGDAMGMPTEMMKPELIRKIFPDGVDGLYPSTEYDFIGRKFPAGEVTDDTINTILVCNAIIENKGIFDTRLYIDYLLKWVEENGDKNPYIMGPNTLKAITAIKDGADIKETGKFSTTNGSAMKISPIGIVYDYRDEDIFIDQVEKLCLPTHNTSIAISGAATIAACVSYAIRGGKDLEEMWKLAVHFSEKAESRGNQLPSASIKERMAAIENDIKQLSEEEMIEKLQHFYGTGMETIETVPAVMAIVRLSNGDPERSARISANIGGDTDTIGAIATAICGAMNPIENIQTISVLEKVNDIDFTRIAESLVKIVQCV